MDEEKKKQITEEEQALIEENAASKIGKRARLTAKFRRAQVAALRGDGAASSTTTNSGAGAGAGAGADAGADDRQIEDTMSAISSRSTAGKLPVEQSMSIAIVNSVLNRAEILIGNVSSPRPATGFPAPSLPTTGFSVPSPVGTAAEPVPHPSQSVHPPSNEDANSLTTIETTTESIASETDNYLDNFLRSKQTSINAIYEAAVNVTQQTTATHILDLLSGVSIISSINRIYPAIYATIPVASITNCILATGTAIFSGTVGALSYALIRPVYTKAYLVELKKMLIKYIAELKLLRYEAKSLIQSVDDTNLVQMDTKYNTLSTKMGELLELLKKEESDPATIVQIKNEIESINTAIYSAAAATGADTGTDLVLGQVGGNKFRRTAKRRKTVKCRKPTRRGKKSNKKR